MPHRPFRNALFILPAAVVGSIYETLVNKRRLTPVNTESHSWSEKGYVPTARTFDAGSDASMAVKPDLLEEY